MLQDRGKLKENVVPAPTWLSTEMRPPCRSIIPFAIYRPRPPLFPLPADQTAVTGLVAGALSEATTVADCADSSARASPIEIAVSTQNGTAQLSVVDHGPGLRPEDRGRIFEPFYRADPSRSRDSGGAGLGLSIVNAVVVAHGGRVQVKETSGGGATFEVALPLASGPG